MPMMTGAQYKESLKDGRLTYIDGDQVTDPANHPLLKTAVDVAARVYDSFYSAEPDAANPAYIIPRSIDDYRDSRGEEGSMQDEFLVHTRAGEECPRCGERINRIVVGGRSTYFCPGCQVRLRRRRRPRKRRR